MDYNKKLWLIIMVILIQICNGCSDTISPEPKKELLIYCGITMIKPVSEIAEIIEAQYHCNIIITKGGSGNLLKSIKINKVGDLYLPGSETYIISCLEAGLITKTVHVGYNKAALMVQKGNPKNISADLINLQNSDYYVVVGNPDSGSIGKETQKILKARGILNEVMHNARKLTTDSKDLIAVLKNKEADLVVNWFATSTWDDNAPDVDAIAINGKYAHKKKLILGLLTTSNQPDIATAFMTYACSSEGLDIFNNYGLYHVP